MLMLHFRFLKYQSGIHVTDPSNQLECGDCDLGTLNALISHSAYSSGGMVRNEKLCLLNKLLQGM